MVRHGHGRHFLFGDKIHKLADLARAVEQRVVGVAVKMDEWRVGHRDETQL
jgi:hypothetical protein